MIFLPSILSPPESVLYDQINQGAVYQTTSRLANGAGRDRRTAKIRIIVSTSDEYETYDRPANDEGIHKPITVGVIIMTRSAGRTRRGRFAGVELDQVARCLD